MTGLALHFRGIALGPSGYAGEGRDWLRAFANAGVEASLEGASFGDATCALEPADIQVLRTAASRARVPGAPTFHLVPAHAYAHDAAAPRNVLRTMFETEAIPVTWREPLARADAIVVPTEEGRQAFVRGGIAPSRLHVVPPPLPTARHPAPSEARARRGPFKILAIGEWTPRKAHDLLVAAFAREFARGEAELWIKTHAQGRDAAFVQDACERIARQNSQGTPPVVRVLGTSLPPEQMEHLYAACDALALPSRGEGWGRPVHEAMLRGIPVVATRAGALATLLPGREHGWPVQSHVVPVDAESAAMLPLFAGQCWHEPDPDDLGAQLRAVCDQPVEAHRRAVAAHRHVSALCDPQRVVEEALRVLDLTSAAGL